MTSQEYLNNQYDVASVSRKGQEKRANFVQNAMFLEKPEKSAGNFVKVLSDIFLKCEPRGNSCV